jgi:hypothetical protein
MGKLLQCISSWLKRASNEPERVIAHKGGYTLKAHVRVGFFTLCKDSKNAQSVMPVQNYANMPKT